MRQMSGQMRMPITDPLTITGAIRFLTGDPELVIVDFRVLKLLLGDLAGLIVLDRVSDPDFHGLGPQFGDPEQDSFAWDDESPCD